MQIPNFKSLDMTAEDIVTLKISFETNELTVPNRKFPVQPQEKICNVQSNGLTRICTKRFVCLVGPTADQHTKFQAF